VGTLNVRRSESGGSGCFERRVIVVSMWPWTTWPFIL
jgi:hypothetical protein